MLIIPKDILFIHTMYNMEVIGSPFNRQMGTTVIGLIGLITSTDFNWLPIDLKLVIIDFRTSVDSQL